MIQELFGVWRPRRLDAINDFEAIEGGRIGNEHNFATDASTNQHRDIW